MLKNEPLLDNMNVGFEGCEVSTTLCDIWKSLICVNRLLNKLLKFL